MKITKVEIFPGYSIEVNAKSRGKGRLSKAQVLRSKISDSERRAIMETIPVHGQQKYSKQILDEAVRIARMSTVAEAVRVTGVKHWSIVQRKRELIAAGKYEKKHDAPGGKARYTMEQKKRCVELALKLMASKETKRVRAWYPIPAGQERPFITLLKWKQRPAFIEAGKRLGMNGRSIEWQWTQGSIK